MYTTHLGGKTRLYATFYQSPAKLWLRCRDILSSSTSSMRRHRQHDGTVRDTCKDVAVGRKDACLRRVFPMKMNMAVSSPYKRAIIKINSQ